MAPNNTVNPAATMMSTMEKGNPTISGYVPAGTPEPLTPAPSDSASSPMASGDENRKKRKSWGQAIPKFDAILPPGKRAKTDAEKEQRRCERIMRNRKAAASSRDRKKQEFEKLEAMIKNSNTEATWVRKQAQEQIQRILQVAFPDGILPPSLQNIDMDLSPPAGLFRPVPGDDETLEYDGEPTPPRRRQISPATSVASMPSAPKAAKDTSPTLTPDLFLQNDGVDAIYAHTSTAQSMEELFGLSGRNNRLEDVVTNAMANPQPILDTFGNLEGSNLTQYPAEVLCFDPQCQLEPTRTTTKGMQWVHSILIIQLMVASAMSSFSSMKMISFMSQVLTSLERIWPQALASPSRMDLILPLIHSLIFTPLKTTPRRAFRMAILRKLLACSQASARHFDDALSRALCRLSSVEAIQDSQQGAITWSSLMAMRWAIKRIERENDLHQKRIQILATMSHHIGVGDRSLGELSFEAASRKEFQLSHDRACTPEASVYT